MESVVALTGSAWSIRVLGFLNKFNFNNGTIQYFDNNPKMNE